jgi:hypothetical protein
MGFLVLSQLLKLPTRDTFSESGDTNLKVTFFRLIVCLLFFEDIVISCITLYGYSFPAASLILFEPEQDQP